jgi:hypothetical protein
MKFLRRQLEADPLILAVALAIAIAGGCAVGLVWWASSAL